MLAGGPVQGVVRMLQADESTCVVDGTIDGLRPGPHRVAIHEYGDLSDGCQRYALLPITVEKSHIINS